MDARRSERNEACWEAAGFEAEACFVIWTEACVAIAASGSCVVGVASSTNAWTRTGQAMGDFALLAESIDPVVAVGLVAGVAVG